ncbi:MAG: methytransferase partner Trm112 [Dehalococcoidia bacterium]
MRHDLMEILVCPMCKGKLDLVVHRQDGDEIVEGRLTCTNCRETYPIEEGIPNMLPPDLRDE